MEVQASVQRNTTFSVLMRMTNIIAGLNLKRDSQHTHVGSVDEDDMESNIHDIDNESNNDEQPYNALNRSHQREQKNEGNYKKSSYAAQLHVK